MPLDPGIKRFLKVLNSNPRVAAMTVAERRTSLEELIPLAGPVVPMARVESWRVPGPGGALEVRAYTPVGTNGLGPGMVYFHGGGFVAGTLATHDAIARALAAAGLCRIVSVGYRLAPEHRFPAAVDDALAASTYIAAHAGDFGIDARRLGICGDSAGGALAAATCHTLGRTAPATFVLQLLLCPVLDYTLMTESRQEFASGYFVTQATLDHDLHHYLPPGTDADDPRVSPLRATELPALPQTLIHTAECDPLRDEGQLYFERLSRAGTPVSYTCHPGMIHQFYGLGGIVPYTRTAFEHIGAQVRLAFQ